MLFRVLLLAALASVPAHADPAQALKAQASQASIAAGLRDTALASNLGYSLLESLTTEVGQRLAGTAAEARGRDWAVAKMKALGFANVHVEPFTLPRWDRGIETAQVLGAHSQMLVVTALGRSGATPAQGIEADVVRFADLQALVDAAPGSLTGKIAFIDHKMMPTQDGSSYGPGGQPRRVGPSLAASKGAVAVLIRSAGTDYHRNPHTGGTSWAAGVTPVAAGALSLPDAEQLNRLLALGPVRLKLVMTPQLSGVGQSGNVVGDVPGTTDEVVVIGGHLDSWDLGTGAIDDGAGVAITMATAKLILDAVKDARAPKLRRTIRVVAFGSEEPGVYGGAAYAKAHAGDKTVLAAESDFGADRIWKLESRVRPEALPMIAQMVRVAAPLGVAASASNDARGGADVEGLAALGVPTLELQQDGTHYFDLHHTPDDTLDKVDPKALAQNVAVWASTIWLAASSDVAFGPVASDPVK